jgi:hypothetical protein
MLEHWTLLFGSEICGGAQGCQIFLGTTCQNGKNQITMKYTQRPQNIPNGHKIDQMSITYSNIFHWETLQNLPKSGLKICHLATLEGALLKFMPCFRRSKAWQELCFVFYFSRGNTLTFFHRRTRVARFFLCMLPKTGKNVPNEHSMYQMVIEYTKCV